MPVATPSPSPVVERFRASMVGNFDRWHDGLGYDLDLLRSASPEERAEIERLLLQRPVDDWRMVEALAALDSPRAGERLRQALADGSEEVRTAVLRHAPQLASEEERIATLVRALASAEFYGGLTEALTEIETFHPPEVIDALFRGALTRDGTTATHLAAMLMYVHGQAESAFDWDLRPFFLEFNTEDRLARETAFRELCRRLGVAAETYLPPDPRPDHR